MNTAKIEKLVAEVNLNDPESVKAVANKLVESEVDFKRGAEVALIDDPTYGLSGIKAKYKGVSAKGSGFSDVELPNGTVVAVQSDLLLPVPA